MIELLEENFRVVIETEKGEIPFVFGEGKFREILEIEKKLKNGEDPIVFLFDFLNSHGKISKSDFCKINEKKLMDIFQFVLKKWSGGYFSFSDKKEKANSAPSSSWVVVFLEKICKSMDDFLDMRWRTIVFLLDGMVWNSNELTPEGKMKNKMASAFAELKNF